MRARQVRSFDEGLVLDTLREHGGAAVWSVIAAKIRGVHRSLVTFPEVRGIRDACRSLERAGLAKRVGLCSYRAVDLRWVCPVCGTSYEQRPDGETVHGCPACGRSTSGEIVDVDRLQALAHDDWTIALPDALLAVSLMDAVGVVRVRVTDEQWEGKTIVRVSILDQRGHDT